MTPFNPPRAGLASGRLAGGPIRAAGRNGIGYARTMAGMRTILSGARPAAGTAVRRVVDAVLPPRCLACGEIVSVPGAVCATCWSGLGFVSSPYCACCGLPFAYESGPDALCGACAGERPVFARARSVMTYDDASRRLILAFKHADRIDAAPAYGAWMARAGAELLADSDAVVPVPLHRWRLLRRRYNQAALLARAVAHHAGVPAVIDALRRTRSTPSQGRMTRSQREQNVRGAFAVDARRRGQLAGKRIVLVDDVMTTGATLSACARPLLRAGAERVDALTLARVTRTG